MKRLMLVVTVGALASCHPPPLPIEEGCSPLLAGVDCGLPYPSDFFLVDDPSLPSGKRIQIPERAKMITNAGASADVNDVWAADGFSPSTPIVVAFGVGVDGGSVQGIFDDAGRTTQKGFATALIEADSGHRVPHFVDVDPRAEDKARQGLILNPLEPLKPRTRYVVALSGVKSEDGKLIAAPEAFRRLRDQDVGDDDEVLFPLHERYEKEIFPVLEKDGMARADLQLAWDFTTASEERPLDDMLTARAVALEELERTAPVVEIDAVFEGDALAQIVGSHPETTWRLVQGFVTGPRVVDKDDAGALLVRDADGKVILNGTTRFPFTAVIPTSVKGASGPVGTMLFGHGFFGDRDELKGDAARQLAESAGLVAIAIDWQGMSVDDIGQVVTTAGGEVSKTILFGERVMQAMVNWSTVTRALELALFDADAAFRRPEDDSALIDRTKPTSFLGISMGHLLGGTLVALNADIERAVLMVGGSGLGTMMFRARPFSRFLALFNLPLNVPDPLDQRKLGAMMQSQFDRFEPATYARFVLNDALPQGPDNGHERRRVLQMMGIGDTQVPNLGSENHARAMGLPLLVPSPLEDPIGLEEKDYPVEGSGLAVFDLGVDPSFYAVAEPPEDGNIVHEGVRRIPEGLEQVRVFLNEGRIINPCDGPCHVDVSGLDIPE